jgi:arsenate reductase
MIRVLFVCTANAARSQMAEALLASLGSGRFEAASGGSHPADRVSRGTVEVLRAHGIAWEGRFPKPAEDFEHEHWDVVITVCDHAREHCPVFHGAPVVAHWGLPDPAAVPDPDARRDAFHETYRVLRARIERLVALPLESLDAEARRCEVEAIGGTA